MTRSSSDRVKASMKALASAGAICGSATRTKAFSGVAPRSIAASSSVGSQPRSAARSATVVKHMVSVTWPMTSVAKPRPTPSATKQESSASPSTTSGSTSGACTAPKNSIRARKAP